MDDLFAMDKTQHNYEPRSAPHFHPGTIIFTTKTRNAEHYELAKAICRVYSHAQVVEKFNLPHNKIDFKFEDRLELHYYGKSTLVFARHNSPLRCSYDDNNCCPNYWHFSPYSFCPYDCLYCYLAGTPGVKQSPTVKIFLNLSEILNQIDHLVSQLAEPTAFYLGRLQDALALDPLTGYSRIIIPFFARHKYARQIMLTKSENIQNILDLDHNNHTILSWSLNPPEISSAFEANIPSVYKRIAAMKKCADAGYPIRAVIMPIIPIGNWRQTYEDFLRHLLNLIPLKRITIGQICSYPDALNFMERKLGPDNPISMLLAKAHEKSPDGRTRFPIKFRIDVYKHIIETIKSSKPALPVALCMEEPAVFDALNIQRVPNRCNCVL